MNKLHANVTLLDVSDLSVRFQDSPDALALDSINFSLKANEIVGIVGETGAGKSVLARALIDMLPVGGEVVGGNILVNGKSVLAMSDADKRAMRGGEVALIGTNAKLLLDPVVPVGKQISRVLMAHRKIDKVEAWREAIDVFKQVGIVNPEARAHAYPHELSGGMAQRVVIAMALISHPQILLADDATLGLDATIQLQVLDLMVQKGRDLGMGVVLITHDLGMVAHYCDRVGIMHKGKLLELQPVKTFFGDGPQTAHGEALLDAAKIRPTPRGASHESRSAPIPTTAAKPLLEIANLVKTFAVDGSKTVVRAVDDVSLSIGRGETLALVGESGSGKTTLGQCLVRLIPSDSGTIRFDGKSILDTSQSEFRHVRQRIQMVFQEPYVSLNPRWQVRELIAEPLSLLPRMSGADREQRVIALLASVQLPAKRANAYPHELTAGEQKRVGIARALAARPDFIIFDEPTTALDIRVRGQIIDLVRDLQQEMGLSALFITHDLNSVRSLAHYVAVMRHGKIVERGETEEIFARPVQDYTKTLLQAELPIEESIDLRAARLIGRAA